MDLRVDLLGAEDVQRRLATLPEQLREHVLAQMAQIAYDTAFREADAHTQTGALIASLDKRPIEGGWEIGHDLQQAPHALFVHWGTRPHEIRAKNRKALRWPSGNGFLFAKWVKHPGYAGDPWMVHAKDEVVRRFDEIVRRVEDQI